MDDFGERDADMHPDLVITLDTTIQSKPDWKVQKSTGEIVASGCAWDTLHQWVQENCLRIKAISVMGGRLPLGPPPPNP